jgi:FtsP/CotA-like multicopper oxidase with cupredoxin domain
MQVRRGWLVSLPFLFAIVATPWAFGRFAVAPAAAHLAPPADNWPTLPTLQNASAKPGVVELNLTASPTQLELVPGKPTEAWAYNGMVPGPTIELREGDFVTVHFTNKLKQATTIHWHGLHLPASHDGSPLHPVLPGASRDYVFRIPRDSAGTYWYHPHPDMTTTEQVSKGLYGALIIRPAKDPLEGIPERLLVLSDNRFTMDGAVDIPHHMSQAGNIDAQNGREGEVLFINGRTMPSMSIRPGELQRLRIINAAAARVFRLAIPGQKMIHVGNDGGLFEKPREVDELLVANSERVEVLVKGGEPDSRTMLRTLPYDRYSPQTRPKDWQQPRDLLEIRTTTDPPVPAFALPQSLRVVRPIDTKVVAARRTLVFAQGMIDNKLMDMKRVDIRARLNTTEIWQVENVVDMDHPFHLHGFQFQVLDRNGVPEPYVSWKDSVNVPKHAKVRFAVRFENFAGKWMYHCHILDHEDMGMMGILELVRGPGK